MKVSKLKLVVALGLALRVALWALQVDPAGDDGRRYLRETINLVDYGVFSVDQNVPVGEMPSPDAHDMPLWPATMAVFYKLSQSVAFTQYASVALNVLLMGVTVWFLGLILRSEPFCVGENGRALGCAVLLFMPDSIMYSLYHMPDMMAVCFVTIGMWSYFKFINSTRFRFMVSYSLFWGLAILSKPICLPLFVALLLALPFVLQTPPFRRIVWALAGFAFVAVMLAPWVIRNQRAFGTAGLTTISGTNLYFYNWKRLVQTFSSDEQAKCYAEMRALESRLQNTDKMASSKAYGAYARKQILAHLPQYVQYTLVQHPRMYVGTGTVAMLRYLGLNRICYALEDLGGKGNHPPNELPVTYSTIHRIIGIGIQVVSWLVLLGGYLLIIFGIVNIMRRVKSITARERILWLCPLLCLMLLAVVIGPIATTRYRFIMIPYFSILAAFAIPNGIDKSLLGGR